MTKVFYTKFASKLPEKIWKHYINQLPVSSRNRIVRFMRWEDSYAHLFGKLLLLKGLQDFGYGPDCLEHVKINYYGKPYLNSAIDFNVSHSGGFVVCGLSRKMKLGIDIEKIRPTHIEHYKSVFTQEEWTRIQEADHPLACFYKYWTIKESVAKAEGKGLSLPFEEIQVANERFTSFGNTTWYLQDLNLDSDYSSWMATGAPIQENIVLHYVDFYQSYPEAEWLK